jgi:hypothetical protein
VGFLERDFERDHLAEKSNRTKMGQKIHCGFLGIIGFLVTFIGCIVLHNYLNVPECGYDENDCCLSNRNTTFCEDCACHLGKCSD